MLPLSPGSQQLLTRPISAQPHYSDIPSHATSMVPSANFGFPLPNFSYPIEKYLSSQWHDLTSWLGRTGHKLAESISHSVTENIGPVSASVLLIGAALYANRKIPALCQGIAKLLPLDSKKETELATKAQPVARATLMIITTSLVLESWGIDAAKFVLGLGVFSTAIGLTLRDQFSNFFGGMVIKTGDRFQVGDFVQIGIRHGRVADVGIACTTLLGVDDNGNIVPIKINNGSILSQDVIVKEIDQDFINSIAIGDRFICGKIHGEITGENEFCFFYASKDPKSGEETTGILRFEDVNSNIFKILPRISV